MSTNSQFPVLLSVTISESDSAYEIHADITGFHADDVTVTAWEDSLIIEMQSKHEENQSYYLGEFEPESYRRVIPLGFQLCQDRIESRYNNGTLTINVAKLVDQSVTARRTKQTSA